MTSRDTRHTITNYLTAFADYLVMEKEKIQFAAAVVTGFIIMILFAVFTVNIMQLIPLFGPFVGGLVAGFIAGKGILNGGRAALMAGLLGAVAVAVDLMADTSYLKMAIPASPQIVGLVFLLVALLYFPILAFIGGVFGATIRH